MGLAIAKFYFEDSIPEMKLIKEKFSELTGLDLQLNGDINSATLPSNSRQVIEDMIADISDFEKHENNLSEVGNDINYIHGFRLYTPGFYEIDVKVSEEFVELESFIEEFYFAESLHKTFYELGGRFVDFKGNIRKDWQPPKRWKKLKKWDDYKWYNRPKK